MRLEALYRARFSTPEHWSTELTGPGGAEGHTFLFVEVSALVCEPLAA